MEFFVAYQFLIYAPGCLAQLLEQGQPLARNSESHRFLESGVGRGFDPALLIQKTHFYLQIKYFYL